jgi:hypothetical protein
MKGKYITMNIRMACTKKRNIAKKDIYTQLEETIMERKKIFAKLEKFSETGRVVEWIITDRKAA